MAIEVVDQLVEGGEIAGQALIKAIGGKGSLYIQNVTPGISTTDERGQGCKNAIAAANGAVTLVGMDYNGDSSATAAQQTSAILQRDKTLSGIFGTNLFGAEGAAQAVKNANRQGTIKIASFDLPQSRQPTRQITSFFHLFSCNENRLLCLLAL